MIVRWDLHHAATIMIGMDRDRTIVVPRVDGIIPQAGTMSREEGTMRRLLAGFHKIREIWTEEETTECAHSGTIHRPRVLVLVVITTQCPLPAVTVDLVTMDMEVAAVPRVTTTISEDRRCLRAMRWQWTVIRAVMREARRGMTGPGTVACGDQCHTMTAHQRRG